jgi:hypothetical protein
MVGNRFAIITYRSAGRPDHETHRTSPGSERPISCTSQFFLQIAMATAFKIAMNLYYREPRL